MTRTRKDRFDNPVEIGDMVVYYGKTLGLVVGVIVKFNPLSYKIKSKKTYKNSVTYHYHNIPFSYSNNIATLKSLSEFKSEDFLDDLEKAQVNDYNVL